MTIRAVTVRLTVTGVVLLAAFFALGALVTGRPPVLDTAVANALSGQYDRPDGQIAKVVSLILGPTLPYVFGAGLLLSALRWRNHAGLLLRLTLVLALCGLTSIAFKPLFHRQRPRVYPDLSYPSGHVTSVASTGFVAILLCLWLAPKLINRVWPVVAFAVVLCAAARVVYGVHWVTDTIGSVLVVGGVGLLASAALRVLPPRPDGVISRE